MFGSPATRANRKQLWISNTTSVFLSSSYNLFMGNSSVYSTGNSTVDALISPTSNLTINASAFQVGNSTVYSFGNSTTDALVSPTSNVTLNTTSFSIGNSTIYSSGNSTVDMWVGTATQGNLSLSATLFNVGNSVANMTVNATTVFMANSTVTTAPLWANLTGQSISGGCTVAPHNIGVVSSGTNTINCGSGPLQYMTNNGAFTLAAPGTDGSCVLQILNGASAGTITFSGWTTNATAGTGDTYNTTNLNVFNFHIVRINGKATYCIKEIT
jgi:hypothetical protein